MWGLREMVRICIVDSAQKVSGSSNERVLLYRSWKGHCDLIYEACIIISAR